MRLVQILRALMALSGVLVMRTIPAAAFPNTTMVATGITLRFGAGMSGTVGGGPPNFALMGPLCIPYSDPVNPTLVCAVATTTSATLGFVTASNVLTLSPPCTACAMGPLGTSLFLVGGGGSFGVLAGMMSEREFSIPPL